MVRWIFNPGAAESGRSRSIGVEDMLSRDCSLEGFRGQATWRTRCATLGRNCMARSLNESKIRAKFEKMKLKEGVAEAWIVLVLKNGYVDKS